MFVVLGCSLGRLRNFSQSSLFCFGSVYSWILCGGNGRKNQSIFCCHSFRSFRYRLIKLVCWTFLLCFLEWGLNESCCVRPEIWLLLLFGELFLSLDWRFLEELLFGSHFRWADMMSLFVLFCLSNHPRKNAYRVETYHRMILKYKMCLKINFHFWI